MVRPRTGRALQVAVRLTRDEYDRLVETARRQALTPAAYLRACANRGAAASRRRLRSSPFSPELTSQLALALLSIKRDANDVMRRVRAEGSRAVLPGELAALARAVDRLADAFEGAFGRAEGGES